MRTHRWVNEGKRDNYCTSPGLRSAHCFHLYSYSPKNIFSPVLSSLFFSFSFPLETIAACPTEYLWLVQMQASLAWNRCLQKLVLYQRHCSTTCKTESFHDALFFTQTQSPKCCTVHVSTSMNMNRGELCQVAFRRFIIMLCLNVSEMVHNLVVHFAPFLFFCPCSLHLRNGFSSYSRW